MTTSTNGVCTRLMLSLSLLLGLFTVVPQVAWAQAGSIAGVVTDTTGGVLPGVLVEVRSPVLIEQVRTAGTTAQGLYRVVNLRPGEYEVTFSLPGFANVVREGIVLSGDAVANVDAQMPIGTVEETITVTGESPVVDIQSVTRREVMTSAMIEALPQGRHVTMIGAVMPAVNQTGTKDVGGLTTMQQTAVPLAAYGSRDMALEIDGLPITFPLLNGLPGVYHDVDAFEEFNYEVSGATAQGQTGGVRVNMISRQGSNIFSGRAGVLWAGPSLQTNNIGSDLLARGVVNPPALVKLRDNSAGVGGPIVKDKLWFYFAARAWGVDTEVNMLHDGSVPGFAPGEPVVDENTLESYMLQLTGNIGARNKVSIMYTRLPRFRRFFGVERLNARPEAVNQYLTPNSYISTAQWTFVPTSNILVQAGVAPIHSVVQGVTQPGARAGDIRRCDLTLNLCRDAVQAIYFFVMGRQSYTSSVSYVTGAHQLKVGYLYSHHYNIDTRTSGIGPNPIEGRQEYRNGVPNAFRAYNTPIFDGRTHADEHGFYVQETYTRDRLTLNPGLRFDLFTGSIPDQTYPAGRFTGVRTLERITDRPRWTDWAPRFGVAYDVFGTGRTALKASAGKYVLQQSTGATRLYHPLQPGFVSGVTSDRRNWDDLNGDDVAQLNELGPSRNPTFALVDRLPDPDLQREYDLVYSVSVDHEVTPGLGLTVAYHRRSSKNLSWDDSILQDPSDYERLDAMDPVTGQTVPIFQIIPGTPLNRHPSRLKTSDSNSRTFNGVDVLFHARLPSGINFAGGLSTGRIVNNLCEVENPNGGSLSAGRASSDTRFCDESKFDIPFQTSYKVNGSIPLPWLNLRVSGVFQSLPGTERLHSFLVTRADVPQLVTLSSVLVRQTEPGSLFFDRINELDLSLSGTVFARGRVRITPRIDLFNVFNDNNILTERGRFPNQDRPDRILAGRVFRLGAQVTF